MNDFLQDVLDIKLSNKVPDRKIKKQSKVSSVEFADGEEVAQGFGKEEHQGKPASDPQTFDKAKGEFADGEEVKVEDFKASSKKVKTSGLFDGLSKLFNKTLGKPNVIINDKDEVLMVPNKDSFNINECVFMPIEEAVEAEDYEILRDEKYGVLASMLVSYMRENGELDKYDIKPIGKFGKELGNQKLRELSSKKVKTSSDDVKITDDELVLMNEDGKVLSTIDDQHVDFLDTVDDPDGGYGRAVKFNSYRDAHQALWNMYGEDIPEDIVTIKAKDAFAFVEDSECK